MFTISGAILGGASAAALGSVAGIAIITTLFGAAGAGLTGYKMKRRVGGIDEFKFHPLSISAQPNITIAISGWLSENEQSMWLSFYDFLPCGTVFAQYQAITYFSCVSQMNLFIHGDI